MVASFTKSGTELQAGETVEGWADRSGLNWTAQKARVRFAHDGLQDMPDRFVLKRSDTGQPLSIVSDRYEPVQPYELIEFAKSVVDGLENFSLDRGGVLNDGERIWLIAKDNRPLTVGDPKVGDLISRYFLFLTGFDLQHKTILSQIADRLACTNGMTASSSENVYSKKHLQAFDMKEASEAVRGLDEDWVQYYGDIDKLVEARVPYRHESTVARPAARQFFHDVFYPGDVHLSPSYSEKGADRRVDRVMSAYQSAPGQTLSSAAGTAWGLVNAVTYFVDHDLPSRSDNAQMSRAWFGDGAQMKQRAFDLAKEYYVSNN